MEHFHLCGFPIGTVRLLASRSTPVWTNSVCCWVRTEVYKHGRPLSTIVVLHQKWPRSRPASGISTASPPSSSILWSEFSFGCCGIIGLCLPDPASLRCTVSSLSVFQRWITRQQHSILASCGWFLGCSRWDAEGNNFFLQNCRDLAVHNSLSETGLIVRSSAWFINRLILEDSSSSSVMNPLFCEIASVSLP